jgi:hypothetical protein
MGLATATPIVVFVFVVSAAMVLALISTWDALDAVTLLPLSIDIDSGP